MLVGKKPIHSNDSIVALSTDPVNSLNPFCPDPPAAADRKPSKSLCRDQAPESRSSIVFDQISGTGTTSSTPASKATSLSRSSFAQRKSLPPRLSRQSSDKTTSIAFERDKMMRNIDRPPPGDPSSRRKSQVHPEVQRKRSDYFQAEFAASNRDPDPVRCRVQNEALVLAEFKTNVMIKDEFSFITDFSYQLSNRYQRPVSSIAVTVNHSQCMLFGGSFDSAYTLIIHALPSLTQPTTNKRNAALIQKHIEETLGVKPARGYVRFVATPEDMVATGGRTIAGEIEDSGGNPTTDETESSSRKSSKGNRRISVKSIGSLRAHAASSDSQQRMPTPPPSATESITPIPEVEETPPLPPTPPDDEKLLNVTGEHVAKTAPRRKSFRFGIFGSKQAPGPSDKRPKTTSS